MLNRLANDTGGRLTHNTNDLSLALARAQRDSGCQYTIGFYLPKDIEDKPKTVGVDVLRSGLSARHPSRYMFRSKSAKRSAGLQAAFLAPEMFYSSQLRVHLFPLQPSSPKEWDALIAVWFPVEFDAVLRTTSVEFGAVLRHGPKVVHQFNREATLRLAAGHDHLDRRFMFLEPVTLKPGEYELTLVTDDTTHGDGPDAIRTTLRVPELSKKELMLVEPILGRARDRNVVVRGTGQVAKDSATADLVAAKGSFEPLLVQLAAEDDALRARNKACVVGAADKNRKETSVHRAVVEEGGAVVPLPTIELELPEEGKVRCQNIYELLPGADAGRYRLETAANDSVRERDVQEAIRFALEQSPPPR